MRFVRRSEKTGGVCPEKGEFEGSFEPTPPAENPPVFSDLNTPQGELGEFSSPLCVSDQFNSPGLEYNRFEAPLAANTAKTPPAASTEGPETRGNPSFSGEGEFAVKLPPAWERHCEGLNPRIPLASMRGDRWRTYCADAEWLIATHGRALASAGWSLVDLFEILPGQRDAGGLVELLGGSRSAKITGRVATITRRGSQIIFHAEGGDTNTTGWRGQAPWQPRQNYRLENAR